MRGTRYAAHMPPYRFKPLSGHSLSYCIKVQVIMFDPMYDCYASMARRAGGIVKAVKLNVEDWSVDRSHLEKAFSAKTKLVVVNTPHNPTGKIFSQEDLQYIADLCIYHNAYVLLDEVHILATVWL